MPLLPKTDSNTSDLLFSQLSKKVSRVSSASLWSDDQETQGGDDLLSILAADHSSQPAGLDAHEHHSVMSSRAVHRSTPQEDLEAAFRQMRQADGQPNSTAEDSQDNRAEQTENG